MLLGVGWNCRRVRMGEMCLGKYVTIMVIDTGSGKNDGIHNREGCI